MDEVLNKIYDYSFEEIMGERFARYSKYIIQDRAIPDVRDGLKPVQRRILYAMYKDKNTYDKPYRKSVKTVGNVIGNYHPHGDSSVYDAMVRMSQQWKQKNTYIEMHGNNGSIDGDMAAAMRYTEARLAKISNEMLKDIDKETVMLAPNFDDTILEPTVLPSRFPNLLVNGASGISAGYATNIAPHNLGEIIEATIKRIDQPNCTLTTLMHIIKGPDFPTGGIALGLSEMIKAYKTGKGKIVLQARTYFDKVKGKNQIIVTEIPYETNKASLVKKIDEIRALKKIDGIVEVRDESDREGLRIAIDLKKEAKPDLILNYLLKNTDLQISYSFNMVAIVNRRPKLLSLIDILDAYIDHQKEVLFKRTEFDLKHAKMRLHIVEGLIKAISVLDLIIATIRKSNNKKEAKDNLIKQFLFTEIQAEAIVTLQLYRLTNTDVTLLENELNNLNIIIKGLTDILNDEDKLKMVIKDELRKIKKEYNKPRLTDIKEEITEIKIDNNDVIAKEKVIVIVTNEGYVKRVSVKSYALFKDEETTLKEGDYVIGRYEMLTTNTLLLFTNLGNYLYLPVFEIVDTKWKEMGKHVSNLIALGQDEKIIYSMPVYNFNDELNITLFTKSGMVKRTALSLFKVQRYVKPLTAIKLKKEDQVIAVSFNKGSDLIVVSKKGYGLWFDINEIPMTKLKTQGVKAITLKDDIVISGAVFDQNKVEYIALFTNKNTAKRIKITDLEKSSRAKRGLLLIRNVKTNPYLLKKSIITFSNSDIGIKYNDQIKTFKVTHIPILDRYSVGTTIFKEKADDIFCYAKLVGLNEMTTLIDDKVQTNFLDDFKF